MSCLTRLTAIWLLLALVAGPALSQSTNDLSSPTPQERMRERNTVSLLQDRNFEWGINLQSPDQQDRSNIGTLYPFDGNSSKDPVWTLSQWHGLHSLLDSERAQSRDGAVEYRNAGKHVVFGPGARLSLGLTGEDRGQHTSKYVSKIKTTLGIAQDTWVPGGEYYRLSNMEHLRLKMTARLIKAETPKGPPPAGTAAVAFVGLHIRSVDPASKDLIYFVMPLYDSRERTKRPVRLIDAATGGRFFIYGTGNAALIGDKSFHDKQWITIDKDILPLVRDALAAARRVPKFSTYSANLSDYTISQMNIRWEVSADINVEMEFKDYDLEAQLRPSTPRLSINAASSRVAKGAPADISWTASSVSGDCVIKKDNVILGNGNTGHLQTEPLLENATISLECLGMTGLREVRAITIQAAASACELKVQPMSIHRGQSAQLSWRGPASAQVTIEPGIGDVQPSGKMTVKPTARTNYIMTVRSATRSRPQQCHVVLPVLRE